MLNYAVDRLTALPNTWVYLDGTHSAWLNVGDITDRLFKAGVERLTVSSLTRPTTSGRRTSSSTARGSPRAIAYVTEVDAGDFGSCGNQYWSGGPANNWTGVALDPAKIWSDTATDPTANTAGINSRYASILGEVQPAKRFIIDTSRNGQGPWTPTGEQAGWPVRRPGATHRIAGWATAEHQHRYIACRRVCVDQGSR